MATDLLDYPLTDAGNAERMVVLFGDQFRWVTDREEWLAWDGRRWEPGRSDLVKGCALETAPAPLAARGRMAGEEVRRGRPTMEDLCKHCLSAESARGLKKAVQVARLLNKVWVQAEALDAHSDLLNVANGTLDLRTFEIRPHNRADMLTRVINVPYEPQ